MISAKDVETAIDEDRLIVMVSRSWFLARKVAMRTFDNGEWILQVTAGPHAAKGFITNIDENKFGRQFSVLPLPPHGGERG